MNFTKIIQTKENITTQEVTPNIWT